MGNYLWIFVGISFFACILNVFKNKLCWWLWILAGIGFILQAYLEKNVPMVVLWITYLFVDLYGYYEWSKQDDEEEV